MQDPFDYCEALVRAADKDRYLATLFAPAEHRRSLFALYAFNIEIARVREAVREPLAGEMRLQWWEDALRGEGHGEVAANPVAAALRKAIRRYGLSLGRLSALLAARRFDLYDEPMGSLEELEAYASGASAGLMALAGHILDPATVNDDALIRHAGLAYAIAGLLKAFPLHAARGQTYVPSEILDRHGAVRQQVLAAPASAPLRAALAELRLVARGYLREARLRSAHAPAALVPALLPAASVGALLARMEDARYDPFVPVEIPQWRRQWLIWRAARRPSRLFA